MTVSRRLAPGRTHAVVRRTARRCFFLAPTKWVRRLVYYVIGLAQLRYPSVSLHALVAESTHIHFVVTDTSTGDEPSEVSLFFGYVHSMLARALNAKYGRGENLWCVGSYDNVEVHGDMSLERQLVYVLTNPIKDGLVPRPEDWPGARTLPEEFGTSFDAEKPDGTFFGGLRPQPVKAALEGRRAASTKDAAAPGTGLAAVFAELAREEREALDHERDRRREEVRAAKEEARKAEAAPRRRRSSARARKKKEKAPRPRRDRSDLPEKVTVRIDPPPGYSHLGLEGTRARFRRLMDEEIARIHRERRSLGLSRFMGVRALIAQDPRESAGDTFPTFARNPRIACTGVVPRVEAIRGLQAWRRDVAEKRAAWKDGNRDVVFPAGIYGMWRFHGARAEGMRAADPGCVVGGSRVAKQVEPRSPPAA